jgi:excisionase family DNA binding protein
MCGKPKRPSDGGTGPPGRSLANAPDDKLTDKFWRRRPAHSQHSCGDCADEFDEHLWRGIGEEGISNAPLDPPQLNLTVDEAAALLRVSTRTLRSLISSGELPVVRIRRRVLVSLRALLKWNNAHSTDRRYE